MAILEPQTLATGVAYKRPCTPATVKEIIYFFVSGKKNWSKIRDWNKLKLVKNKSKLRKLWGLEVSTQKMTLTIVYIPFENMLINN